MGVEERRSLPLDIGAPGPSWPGAGASSEQASTPALRPVRAEAPHVEIGGVELELAGFGRRAAGFLIDSLLIWIAATVFAVLIGLDPTAPSIEGQILPLIFRVGYSWPWNTIGWSPGKRVVGLRIVKKGGGPPGASSGFGRSVGALVSDLVLGLGYLWALWDPNNQTWHDKLVGTYVVIAPEAESGDHPQR